MLSNQSFPFYRSTNFSLLFRVRTATFDRQKPESLLWRLMHATYNICMIVDGDEWEWRLYFVDLSDFLENFLQNLRALYKNID